MKKYLLLFSLAFGYAANAQNFWTQKAGLSGTKSYGASFSIGNKGYLAAGQNSSGPDNTTWEYDKASNTWTQRASFPGTARVRPFGFAIGTKGYVGCGYNPSSTAVFNDFWQYDQASNTWTQLGNFPGVARDGAEAFVIGTKAYVGTGWDGSGFTITDYLNDFYEWDQSTSTWTQKANFGGSNRYIVSAFSDGVKGYFCNGSSAGTYQNDSWEYNPSTNTWTSLSTFGNVRVGAATFNIYGRGFVCCGAQNSNTYLNDCWELNTATNTWTQRASISGVNRCGAGGFSIAGYGYVAGGFATGPSHLSELWEYTPVNVGMDEISSELSVSLYPVPVNGTSVLSLSRAVNDGSVSVYDESGKLVQRIVFSGDKAEIRKQDLAPGAYFYSVAEKKEVKHSGKFIVE